MPLATATREFDMILLETAIALSDKPQTWQPMADTDSLYVLIGSLVLALIAFVILMRARF